jgi:osmotically-inducible protein OsmY
MKTLRESVQRALANDPRTQDTVIEVLNKNGVITLSGSVAHSETSEVAESIVHDIDGVVSVVNEIQVEKSDDNDNLFNVSRKFDEDVISK